MSTTSGTRWHQKMDSPVGQLQLSASSKGLTGIRFPTHQANDGLCVRSSPILEQACEELSDYFDGRLQKFLVPCDCCGTTFQMKVWRELLKIPFGTTSSYGAIANKIGRPSAARAVGRAIGKNPLAIVVPCHRVLGANGTLTGFAGGLKTKDALITLEALWTN